MIEQKRKTSAPLTATIHIICRSYVIDGHFEIFSIISLFAPQLNWEFHFNLWQANFKSDKINRGKSQHFLSVLFWPLASCCFQWRNAGRLNNKSFAHLRRWGCKSEDPAKLNFIDESLHEPIHFYCSKCHVRSRSTKLCRTPIFSSLSLRAFVHVYGEIIVLKTLELAWAIVSFSNDTEPFCCLSPIFVFVCFFFANFRCNGKNRAVLWRLFLKILKSVMK